MTDNQETLVTIEIDHDHHEVVLTGADDHEWLEIRADPENAKGIAAELERAAEALED